jgi:DNA-binding NarL/FixJ family response regulator
MSRRIAILSESRLFCEVIATHMAQDPELKPIAAANTVHSLVSQLQGLPVEILLVHANTERVAGGMVWQIKTLLPTARVIVAAFHDNIAETQQWVESGIGEYLPCATSYVSLRDRICGAPAEDHLSSPHELVPRAMHPIWSLAQATASQRNRQMPPPCGMKETFANSLNPET